MTVKSKMPLTVPERVRRRAGFKPGDRLEFKASAGVVTIVPRSTKDPDEMLTPKQAKRLRQSLKQMRQGKTQPWTQIKHELGI